ncbi:MAG: glutamine-hydrolyzing carbamoyl-phosphate synthase small subunit [Proteobacteria bacterium]|jgi:carbamoyl-phosphate synthase small subunit|nr:glutamine-hydrolyzing carbamoyl-phosphate synthase small subunit [Pseudomonadota bacterium]MDA1300329.1 glutamine-hydrolyzing carbamoyl-phosphate synthase small subunit [Pseudomonadota bacterium]
MATALLALENGEVFEGTAIGALGSAVGEVVFNTAMTGYQEILTDPSYARQIVTLTHPHIGNTGVNLEDQESSRIWAEALVIRDLPLMASSWRSEMSLSDYLTGEGVVGIAGIDTRKLTRMIRESGAQGASVIAAEQATELDQSAAIASARAFPGLKGMDLAREVTAVEPYGWREGTWQLGVGYANSTGSRFKVVAYDFGVKRNILRMLVDRGCELTVVPATTPAAEVLGMSPDGVFLSNGPGDPDPCDYAIVAIREIIEARIPVFGICLGLQLLGIAAGMKTRKMNHGHHGANHPVKDLRDGTVLISSQNHGFCLDDAALPAGVRVTHRSLFDQSLQGIELEHRPAFGFQGHPEASPGPHDAAPLFDHFIELMAQAR